MIQQFQDIQIVDKSVLQRVFFISPISGKHDMSNDACLLYSLEGSATVLGSNQIAQISTGEGALMKCGRYLDRWNKRNDDKLNEVVIIHFYPEVFSYVYDGKMPSFILSNDDHSDLSMSILKYNEALNNYITSLRYYFDNPDVLDDDLIKMKFKELVHLLFKGGNEEVRNLMRSLFTKEVIEFREVINKNLYTDVNLDGLAFLTHMSLSSFKRKFKSIFHMTPAKYIKSKRLDKAKDLLGYTDKSIIDISFECGFGDTKVFAKNFKSHFKITPTAYRKQHSELN